MNTQPDRHTCQLEVLQLMKDSENGFFKLVRLWPVLLAVVAGSGSIYVMADRVDILQATTTSQDTKITNNKGSIIELEKQTGIIEYRLQRVDDTLAEQRGDIKEILRAVKKPWPKYHADISVCMLATGELGSKLATTLAAQGAIVDVTCGCIGKAEAQQLGIVPADDEPNVEVRD